ncbi:MAG: phosphoenolpyruvate carboxykinase [Oligoflexia bacterium]|nr:phosphoenolpyruvate carboxykinase [Oligoflexia bacterium]
MYFICLNHKDKQIIIHTDRPICSNKKELLNSKSFREILFFFWKRLKKTNSPLLSECGLSLENEEGIEKLYTVLLGLIDTRFDGPDLLNGPDNRIDMASLDSLVNELYDFWRSFDRFIVLHGRPGPSSYDQRPYRAFNETIESFTHLVRSTYRDLSENITRRHPQIYRQVAAGVNVGLIALPMEVYLPEPYQQIFHNVSFIRQIWIDPPMIIDPPSNKRSGEFIKVQKNPLLGLGVDSQEWLCYPALVGSLLIYIYFHQRFISLGCSLANLFELASDEQIFKRPAPDAIYAYGIPYNESMPAPLAFYDDYENGILAAAVPGDDRFAYFGYLKKMVLTLHNVAMMKRGLMPFHGALVQVHLQDKVPVNILIIGDTGAGKSETLEALRTIGGDALRRMKVIADDMGSLQVTDVSVLGYGTEIGAFIRLDDLEQGYAFGQIDRSIIMNPQRVNSRVVIPITSMEEVLKGHPIHYLLYANNYEDVSDDFPLLKRFESVPAALEVFVRGASMSKGTTTDSGVTHSYFANIFGPPQYHELHQRLAEAVFHKAFALGIFVGEIRTRLGVPGYERSGPKLAAEELFRHFM